ANETDVVCCTLTVRAFSALFPYTTLFRSNANGGFTYTPTANFNGADTFTYTASDGHGGTAIANVTLTVAAVNDPPVAVADSYSATENTHLTTRATLDALAHDTAVDSNALT